MDDKARLAKGAAQAFMGRLGALLEAGSIVVFAWAYGATTFGLYAVLWSYVKVLTAVSDFAMTTALQRFVPRFEESEPAKSAAFAGFALIFSGLVATAGALAMWIIAPLLAGFINASEADAEHLTTVIKIYVWVLPFWTLVEVGTAAIRARRTFGPEIRIRIFYEQFLRLLTAVIFAAVGWLTYGLFVAHLASVAVSAILAIRLVCKSYGTAALTNPVLRKSDIHNILKFALSIMPANMIKKLFSELPIMLLNMFLPGAAGAAAGGYYSLARKIASALQVVRLTFDYVMAPLAAEKVSKKQDENLKDMIRFATKMAVTFALPLGVALIAIRNGLLLAMPAEFKAASNAILVLVIARVFEAATGPASAVIEATGHRLLPAINGIAGVLALGILSAILIPEYGVTGAAIAAAIGINITAWLALLETSIQHKFVPYQLTHQLAILVAVISSGLLFGYERLIGLDGTSALYIVPVWLILTVIAQIRYGFAPEEAQALGRLSRWARFGMNKT